MNLATLTPEQIAQAHGITEDRVYEIADAIEAVMENAPERAWTPSTMGRKIKADSGQTHSVLRWLDEVLIIDSTPRGAWTRYFPLTNERRSRKLYH